MIYKDKTEIWVEYDKKHRTDGPAVEFATGHKYWYLNGIQIPIFIKQTFND